MPKVYLAGPISGLSYEQCTAWRDYAASQLGKLGIEALSPMRHKERLRGELVIDKDYPQHVLTCARGIMTRDRNDVLTCDALLVNLLGAQRVTVGTVMELGWADILRKPVVCIMEPQGNPHDHPMVTEAIGFRTNSLDEAVHCIHTLLRG